MQMTMLALALAFNLVISWLNCRSCGRLWPEARVLGGGVRVMVWCGAIQAAVGFSSVVFALLLWLAYASGHLPPKYLAEAMSLFYILVIVPVIGSGMLIMVQSWIAAYRQRTFANMGMATYNTIAQLSNMYGAVQGFGPALKQVGDLFDSDNSDNPVPRLVFAIVSAALASGIILTYVLIRHYAGTARLPVRTMARA